MCKVSVIIPFYNVENYIAECLDSIIGQTLRDIEIICIDDGSTDKSADIVRRCQARDGRLRLFQLTWGGQAVARNYGIEHARGEYIYFCDSDDYLDRSALETCFREAEEERLDIIRFSGTYFVEMDTHTQSVETEVYPMDTVMGGREMLRHMAADIRPALHHIFIRKSLIAAHDIRFVPHSYLEDNAYFADLYLNAERVKQIGGVYYHRRVRKGSTMDQLKPARTLNGVFNAISYLEGKYSGGHDEIYHSEALRLWYIHWFWEIINAFVLLERDEKRSWAPALREYRQALGRHHCMNNKSAAVFYRFPRLYLLYRSMKSRKK